MTELELYRFITDHDIDWRGESNEGAQDILIFPFIFQLEAFCQLINQYQTDESPLTIKVHPSSSYAAIWMRDICEYFGIDMENVFTSEPS